MRRASLPTKSRIRFLGRRLLILYSALLLLSHAVRLATRSSARPRPDQGTITLQAVRGDQTLPGKITLAYRELRPVAIPNPPAVLLLHGSPMASETFNDLAALLAQQYRVLVPDLPGFRGSTPALPDYSIRAHAHYLTQFLEQLQIPRVHVLGYSQGGGVAIHLTALEKSRVQSVTLLSAIGVQEMELFGDYHLNHAVHGLQLVLTALVQEGLPHFGHLDDAYLNFSYARNFFDSDQRPLRALLQAYQNPALIMHGKSDPLVPLAAALEHHRLLPHSELQLYDGGHELVFTAAQTLLPAIVSFITRVEQGRARLRAQAEPERLARAQQAFDPRTIPQPQGLALAVLMLLLAGATLVSEDLACISAGLLVAHGTVGFWFATTACFFGIFAGDLLLYWCGRLLGPLLARPPFCWFIKSQELERAKTWFEGRGAKAVFFSRFLPGSRLPTYAAAGVLGVNFWRFAFYLLTAVAVWAPLAIWLSARLGQPVKQFFSFWNSHAVLAFLASALVMWALLRMIVPLFTYRGRRLLLSWWRRKTRWEFWPAWWFYPPVVLYCLYLALKHRSLTLFTAANPGIVAGGFIGESKFEILQKLSGANGYIARGKLIAASSWEERRQHVQDFMQQHRLAFPIVLKPDVGQRGAGVAIIRTEKALHDYLREAAGPLIVQEYIAGHEFGVFYYRNPDREKGDIYAITDKRFPYVTGDGHSTLEELILKDDRAVCQARFHFGKHRGRLHEIPAAGERVPLVELGTHCRGALFLDGDHLKTPALIEAIDEVSKKFEGFYFGRYDIRAPSVDDFRQGRNFKVVELNGVTSEATSIYDPRHSLWQAYRVLFKQWRLAFEIAAQNVAAGARPAPVTTLLQSLLSHKTTAP